jgi:hypothetical protein
MERVASRQNNLNLGNDVAASARFCDFWYRDIEPTYHFAVSVDGTDVDAAIRDIAAAVTCSRRRTQNRYDRTFHQTQPASRKRVSRAVNTHEVSAAGHHKSRTEVAHDDQ